MNATTECKKIGWQHPVWDLLRFYLSVNGSNKIKAWLEDLEFHNTVDVEDKSYPIDAGTVELFLNYLKQREKDFKQAVGLLRTEEEALAYCKDKAIDVKQFKTRNQDHHQSSATLVAAVSAIAKRVCEEIGVKYTLAPQSRCVWLNEKGIHVTARRVDGAIAKLANPAIVWEIKEYWGGGGSKSGGSKMSDAVYECHLVGRELRDFELRSGVNVIHIVFLDGRNQWNERHSDLRRFIDLMNQGLVDYLFVGKEVETLWEPTLCQLVKDRVWKGLPDKE